MKKKFRLLFLFTLVLCITFISKVSASQVVNVYLFRGEGCPHCADAEEFFEELSNDSTYGKYYDLIDYEVWYDTDNSNLMNEVGKELNVEIKGVPFIVIGNNYFSGFSSDMESKIKSTLMSEYYSSSYKDIVESVENRLENGTSSESDEKEDSDSYGYDYDYGYNYNYDYDYDDYYDNFENRLDSAMEAIFGTYFVSVILFIIFLTLAVRGYMVLVNWKVFKKAGKNGWEAIIPFYNRWVLYEISGYPGAYMFFAFIPFVGSIIAFVFEIIAAISLAKKFKKDGGFHVLLWLLPVIGYSILAFGDAKYDGSLGENKSFSSNKTNNDESTNFTEPHTYSANTDKAKNFCGNCGCRIKANETNCSNCGKKID